jgi:hypothetical protein
MSNSSLPGPNDRDRIIEEICAGFISPTPANHLYYRVIIETLWPPGTGLPGPLRTRQELRDAINNKRQKLGKPPYNDPFRRLRELQGEEGVLGIGKVGASYRMDHAEVSEKRFPRRAFSRQEVEELTAQSGGRCAVCRTLPSPGNPLTPDHRKPRVRGGGDGLENMQMLCVRCNIHKSVACRGCQENCLQCPWYDAVSNPVVSVRGDLLAKLAGKAAEEGRTAQQLADELIERSLHERQIDGA